MLRLILNIPFPLNKDYNQSNLNKNYVEQDLLDKT